MRRRVSTALLVCALVFTGCWDMRDLDRRAEVLAAGADKCGPDESCKVRMTWQVAIPGRIPLEPGRAVRGGQTVAVLSAEGQDDPDAQGKAQAQLDRQMLFGHIRVFLMSEELARDGLLSYMEWIRSLPQGRPMQWVGIAEDGAGPIIAAHPELGRVPALYLSEQFDTAVRGGFLPDATLGQFKIRLSNRGEDPALPLVRAVDAETVVFTGVAVFRRHRMVGKLDPDETQALMWLKGRSRAPRRLHLAVGPEGFANLNLTTAQVHRRIRKVGRRLQVRYQLRLEGDVIELSPRLSVSDPAMLYRLGGLAAREVERRSRLLLVKLQNLQADLLAVGEGVRAYQPAVWREIRDWRAAFAEIEFQVLADVELRRTGLDNH